MNYPPGMKISLSSLKRHCSCLIILGVSLASLLVSTGCSGLGLPDSDGTDAPKRSLRSRQLQLAAAPSEASLRTRLSTAETSNEQNHAEDDAYPSETSRTAARCRHSDKRLNCVKVISVYDGDTIFVDVPGVHPLFGKRVGVRIYGIDTPERNGQAPCEKAKALEAKNVVEGLISSAKRIDLTELQRDKYFRILAKVLVDGRSVAEELLARRLAYPYFGDTKERREWCE